MLSELHPIIPEFKKLSEAFQNEALSCDRYIEETSYGRNSMTFYNPVSDDPRYSVFLSLIPVENVESASRAKVELKGPPPAVVRGLEPFYYCRSKGGLNRSASEISYLEATMAVTGSAKIAQIKSLKTWFFDLEMSPNHYFSANYIISNTDDTAVLDIVTRFPIGPIISRKSLTYEWPEVRERGLAPVEELNVSAIIRSLLNMDIPYLKPNANFPRTPNPN